MTATLIDNEVQSSSSDRSPTRTQVIVSELVIYEFFDDTGTGDFSYRKSVDGAETWGAAVPIIGNGGGGQWHDIYYERWNGAGKPNVVHLAYSQDFGSRGIWYNKLNLDTDTLGTPVRALSIPAHPTMGNMGLGVARDGSIRVDGRDNFDSNFGAKSEDGLTWTSCGNAFTESGGDRMQVWADFAGAEEDLVAIFWDESALAYSLKRWDKSANTITETAIATHTSGQVDGQWSTTLNRSTGHIHLAFYEIVGAGSNTLHCYDLYGASVTARTNIMAATTYLSLVALARLSTGVLRAYFGQDASAASLSSLEIYYKDSSDEGVTWGTKTLYSSRDAAITRIVSDPLPQGAVAPAWEEDGSDSLYIEAPTTELVTDPDQYRLMLSDGADPDIPILNITPENVGARGTTLIKVERGRESGVLGMPPRAGQATFTLNNAALAYGLDEPAPNLAVRLNKKYDGTWYHLWHGNLDIPSHTMSNWRALMNGRALGPLTKLSGKKVSTELWTNITTGTAIDKILDAAGFPAILRDLDDGDVTLPYFWCSDEDAWSAIWKIVNSEGITAEFYEAGDGKLTFRSRSARYSEARSTVVQNTFRNTNTDPRINAFEYFSGLPEIVNSAKHERYRRTDDTGPTVVWDDVPDFNYIVPPNGSIVVEAVASEPFFDAITPVAGTDYLYGFSAPTVTLERTSGQRTKITFTTDASGTTLTGLQLRATTTINNATYVEVSAIDASASIAAHGLRPWAGEMSKELSWVDMRDNLDAIVSLKKDPRGRIRFSINAGQGAVANEATAKREIGDLVRVIDTNLDFDAECWLERFEHEIKSPAGPADGSALVGSEITTWEASVVTVNVGSSGTGLGANPYDSIDNSVYVLPTTGLDDMGLVVRGLAGTALFAANDF